MKWFVDGYNVIRRDADLRGRESESLEAGRTALLAAVAAAARRTGDQFTVVFDGARRDASPPVTGQVQIVFSRPPETADDVLRALVAKAGPGSVATSCVEGVPSSRPHPVDAAQAIRYKTIVGEHLFIVSRQQLDLYRYLSREFFAESDVVVVLDRRYGERRNRGERRATPRGERRQTDRRGEKQIGGQINTLGYAFVRLD